MSVLTDIKIHNQHGNESENDGIGRHLFIAMTVGFRNQFITDDINHSAACKCKGEWENGSSYADSSKTNQGTDDFNQTGQAGDGKYSFLGDTGHNEW